MATLSEDVKLYIVQALACYDTPSQVVDAVKDEFGLAVSRQQCETYHPERHAGRSLSKKWRVVFEKTREDWKSGITQVPIANRVFRLRVLDRLAAKAERMKNMGLTLQVLEMAAKEMGDAFVNRRIEQPKPPGEEEKPVAEEYRLLRPDEDGPDKPIL